MNVPATRARTKDNEMMESMDILANVLENIQETSVKIVKYHMLVLTIVLPCLFCNASYGVSTLVNLKMKSADTSSWYQSIAWGLFFHTYQNKYQHPKYDVTVMS